MRKLIFLLMLLPILAYSQTKHNVDKIIAKIDNYYILKSEVETLGARAAQEGQKLEKCQAFE